VTVLPTTVTVYAGSLALAAVDVPPADGVLAVLSEPPELPELHPATRSAVSSIGPAIPARRVIRFTRATLGRG
jgi:hypothetical protein